jgi:hypothetical protein
VLSSWNVQQLSPTSPSSCTTLPHILPHFIRIDCRKTAFS